MPPTGRHACRSDPVGHGSGVPGIAWLRPKVDVAIGALCPPADADAGNWDRTRRPCPRACLRARRDHRRGPSLLSRYSSRRSTVLRPPRTPAAHDALSPSAYTHRCAATTAAQTGLSCSVRLPAHVLRPLPRRDLRHDLRTETPQTWPSPRRDRLGSRVVNLSRLQASLQVAARVLAPSVEALDTPPGPSGSRPMPGVCYSALRRLPRRDLHPLETNDAMLALARSHPHDAPRRHYRFTRWFARWQCLRARGSPDENRRRCRVAARSWLRPASAKATARPAVARPKPCARRRTADRRLRTPAGRCTCAALAAV
jgi:hypothetical protein